jgi:ArsR family transcriptional regulator
MKPGHFSAAGIEPAAVFNALGHPARVMVVRRLSKRESCVCDLVKAVGLGWSTVSRHLSVLREAGIVQDEKRGQQVFYRLALPCVAGFIACLDDPGTMSGRQGRGCARGSEDFSE